MKSIRLGLKVEFDPENSTISMKGRFLYDGSEFIVHPSSINFSDTDSSIQNIVFVVGGDEDYQPRMANMGYTVLDADPSMDGVFEVGSGSETFMMRFGQ